MIEIAKSCTKKEVLSQNRNQTIWYFGYIVFLMNTPKRLQSHKLYWTHRSPPPGIWYTAEWCPRLIHLHRVHQSREGEDAHGDEQKQTAHLKHDRTEHFSAYTKTCQKEITILRLCIYDNLKCYYKALLTFHRLCKHSQGSLVRLEPRLLHFSHTTHSGLLIQWPKPAPNYTYFSRLWCPSGNTVITLLSSPPLMVPFT